MTHQGGCHCGAIRYEVAGKPEHVALCHCTDCRKSSGAPMVSWAAFKEDQLKLLSGEPKIFNSSGTALRSFCADCGSGLFYRNEQFLPGIVDIQSATMEDPNALAPQIHIQTAEQLHWMDTGAQELPKFERYPTG